MKWIHKCGNGHAAGSRPGKNRGFTVLELLATTLIIALAGGLIMTTIQMAINQLHDRTRESNAQMLCSALASSVQNELTCAGNIRYSGAGVQFSDHVWGMGENCAIITSEGKLYLADGAGGRYPLASDALYRSERETLSASSEISYGDGLFSVTITIYTEAGEELTVTELTVKPIAPGRMAGGGSEEDGSQQG